MVQYHLTLTNSDTHIYTLDWCVDPENILMRTSCL